MDKQNYGQVTDRNKTATNMGFGVIGAGRCIFNLSNMASSVPAAIQGVINNVIQQCFYYCV